MKISEMSLEQRREYNRERKQRQRGKEKAERQESIEAAHEARCARELNTKEQEYRNRTGKCFFGEVRPGVDADNIADALQVAREMARALGTTDVHDGESLSEFERRIFSAWTAVGAPFLNRQTQQLSPGWGREYWEEHCGGFDKSWKPLPGAKQEIDL